MTGGVRMKVIEKRDVPATGSQGGELKLFWGDCLMCSNTVDLHCNNLKVFLMGHVYP